MAPPPGHCEANNSAHCLSFVGIHLQTIPLMRTPPTVNGFHAAKLFPSLVASYYPQMVLHASHCATPEEEKKPHRVGKRNYRTKNYVVYCQTECVGNHASDWLAFYDVSIRWKFTSTLISSSRLHLYRIPRVLSRNESNKLRTHQ
ncbi:hypothetical protein CDAR_478441 [Caerostris darwini]|uniref:Uncharacterized protein n=1 Tax=Caerostris darwini TaxID=1538125 RepID=A0AAV4VE13_9ARAC|nr:hypothetical protein CDAR_478441 [Caerostris darwini]